MKSKESRFYFLPLNTSCLSDCEICYRLGCRNHRNRTLTEINKIIFRAKKAEFDAMVFSSSFLEHEERSKIFQACLESGMMPILQIQWKVAAKYTDELEKFSQQGMNINFVFTGKECSAELNSAKLRSISEKNKTHFTLAPDKDHLQLALFIQRLPETWLKNLYFHFSPYVANKNLPTTKEIAAALEDLRKKIPFLPIRPPLGREVWDPRIDPELHLESDVEPAFSLKSAHPNPNISIVIPSFNSGPLLKNTLRHLLRQDLIRDDFEIIVVDDGSTDNSIEIIRNFLAPEAGFLNFHYIFFPRSKPRQRGDANFRAGIARNLGVKQASGTLLLFLDADIIVPSYYLRHLQKLHTQHDVVQSVRLHLKNKKRNELVEYSTINPQRDAYVLEKKYWGEFFRQKDWQSISFFWKYTCTYALSLKTEHFKNAGWFRRTFVYYGFEDTDLGFRLARRAHKFYLDPTITYHLETEQDRSEYRKSTFERHQILSKTAKVFYLNNLEQSIFQHLFAMMGNEKKFREIVRDFTKKSQIWIHGQATRNPQSTNPKT